MAKNYLFFTVLLAFLVASSSADTPDFSDKTNPSWYGTIVREFFGAFKGVPSAFRRTFNGLRGKEIIEGPLKAFNDSVESLPKKVLLTKPLEAMRPPRKLFGCQVPEKMLGCSLPVFISKVDGSESSWQCDIVDPVDAEMRSVPVVQGDCIDPDTGMTVSRWEVDQEACSAKKVFLIEAQQSLRGRLSALGVTFNRWISGHDVHISRRDAAGVGRVLAIYTTIAALIGASYLIKKHYFDGDKELQKGVKA